MNKELERYIEAHTNEEPSVLADLQRRTHLQNLRPRMLSGNLQGQFLRMLCSLLGARRVLEIGTYTGYAAISMAAALPDDGLLYTIDINDELEDTVNEYITKSGYGDKIKFIQGDALTVVPTLQETFDLVFIDADKRQYADYYRLVFDKVRRGGLIVADDVLWDDKVLKDDERKDVQTIGILDFNEMVKRDERVEKVMLPLRHGLYLIRKK
ncbi:MAG: class I SAM-dependent methyltransferase [Culturomica sp.]|jgi:predicted O-methyltransferase YrrM|nr:class I SAM-dependent methyltransferase [Culturomica sp.]